MQKWGRKNGHFGAFACIRNLRLSTTFLLMLHHSQSCLDFVVEAEIIIFEYKDEWIHWQKRGLLIVLTWLLSLPKRILFRKGGLAIKITPIINREMTMNLKIPQCSRKIICEKIMTKIGEQKIMVAASPTGKRANPMKMHVTVRHPTIPSTKR